MPDTCCRKKFSPAAVCPGPGRGEPRAPVDRAGGEDPGPESATGDWSLETCNSCGGCGSRTVYVYRIAGTVINWFCGRCACGVNALSAAVRRYARKVDGCEVCGRGWRHCE